MSEYSNLKNDILEAAGDEPILAIVISRESPFDHMEDDRAISKEFFDTPLTWEGAENLLDYNYHTGYGGVDCHCFYAWTETRVLFLGTYDGSTWIASVPRDWREKHIVAQYVGGG